MSQSKVTGYFANRKRTRFNQQDMLAKNKLAQIKTPPAKAVKVILKQVENEKMTRSKQNKLQNDEPSTKLIVDNDCENEKPKEISTKPLTRRASARLNSSSSVVNNEKKEKLAEIKERRAALDDKVKALKSSRAERAQKRQSKQKQDDPVIEETKQQNEIAPVKEKAPVKLTADDKKAKMLELRRKIERFNQAIINKNEEAATTEAAIQKVDEQKKQKSVPSYLKNSNLASASIDHSCTLTLPKHYSQLLESFKGSETIIKFLNNRQETCTFLKLKLAIQNITKHNFTLCHLSQIKTVYPQAYLFKQEKMFIDFKNDYHLIIMPNMEDIEPNAETGVKEFSPHVLLTRLNKFKTNIFNIVKDLHQKFLISLGITNVDSKDLKRWHPKFNLEKCSDIEQSELPKPPNDLKCKSGQELLGIAKEVYSNRMKDAINSVIATTEQSLEESAKQSDDDNSKTKKKNATYNSLLERVRSREKSKAIQTMIINSDKEKQLVRYAQFKDTVRFISFFFQAEKKATLDLDKVANKLSQNLNNALNEMEAKEMISDISNEQRLFGKDNQKWINLIKVRGLVYVKIDKSFEFNDLYSKCEQMIEELKQKKD